MHVGHIGLREFPHGLAFPIHFEDAWTSGAVAAGDEGIAIGQADHAMRTATGRDLAHHVTLWVILPHHVQAVVRNQVVAISQPPSVAHVDVIAVSAFRQQAHLVDDLAGRIDFQ